MKFDETVAAYRKIPVFLQSGGIGVTGFSPAAGELKISLSGDAAVNGGGVWAEIGGGIYTYQCTQAETQTLSYITLIVASTGIDTFCWFEDIGYRIAAGETAGARLRVPIFLIGTAGPVLGASVATETQVSVNGGAFTAPSGTFGESGDGAYYYQAAPSEVATIGSLVLNIANALAPCVYTQSVLDAVNTTAIADGVSGYFGSYFGAGTEVAPTPTPAPTPIPAAVTPASETYVNHAQSAIDRLCEFAKVVAP